MAKQLAYDEATRQKLIAGVSKLANAVRKGMGPLGQNVRAQKLFGSPADAAEIELTDAFEHMGAQLVKEAASKTSDVAGDGTTTATVLAEAIFKEGLQALADGADPIALNRGIDKAVARVVEHIWSQAKKVEGKERLAEVAAIAANNDEVIGKAIADAFELVGSDGVITVEEGKAFEITVDLVEAMQFDRGYMVPYFVTNPETMEAVLEDAYILIYEKKISSVKDLVPVLEKVAQSGRPLLLIAEDIEGEALATLVINKLRGTFRCAAVKAPDYGDRRKAMLQDMAILTGGTVVSEDLGLKLENIQLSQLGTAKQIKVNKDSTTLIQGGGQCDDIQKRIDELRRQIDETVSEYDKENLQKRLAKLAGGMAQINVGAATEAELRERRALVESALHASHAAIEEGVVPGGGTALIHAAASALKDDLGLSGDEALGVAIIRRAVETPARSIAENAGIDSAVVVSKISKSTDARYGYNVKTCEYVDMLEAGIVDPAKVIRSALQNAASVATMLLTTGDSIVRTRSGASKREATARDTESDIWSRRPQRSHFPAAGHTPKTSARAVEAPQIRTESKPHADPSQNSRQVDPLGQRERPVKVWFSRQDDPLNELGKDITLECGEAYFLSLEVGPHLHDESGIAGARVASTGIPPAQLEGVLFAFRDGFAIEPEAAVRVMEFGPDGAAQKPRVQFPLVAPLDKGLYRLRLNLYHKNVLIQSRLLEVQVERWPNRAAEAMSCRLDYCLSPGLDSSELTGVSPHRLSIFVNSTGDGTHTFFFHGEKDFNRTAFFDGDDLKAHIDKMRRTLRRASWGEPGPWREGLPYLYERGHGDRLLLDLVDFAKVGYGIYRDIVTRLAGDVDAMDPLFELMRRPGYVQISYKRSVRMLIPCSIIYDYKIDPDLPVNSYEICEGFLEARRGRAPLEESPCFRGDCPSRGKLTTVCPSGFWGYRHNLGTPLSVSSAGGPIGEIEFEDRPHLAMAVSTDLDDDLRSSHEVRLKGLLPVGLGWSRADSRETTIALLKAAKAHVVYFYCHGGVDDGTPYLRVGSRTEAYISASALSSHDIRWPATRPLVFLNGCHTTALEPELVLDLVTGFVVDARASGVVGTEISIFESLACAFAEECLGHFLSGSPLGDAVRKARLELLRSGNPLGLVYIPFAVPTLRLVKKPAAVRTVQIMSMV